MRSTFLHDVSAPRTAREGEHLANEDTSVRKDVGVVTGDIGARTAGHFFGHTALAWTHVISAKFLDRKSVV